jgi:hypothetical protein
MPDSDTPILHRLGRHCHFQGVLVLCDVNGEIIARKRYRSSVDVARQIGATCRQHVEMIIGIAAATLRNAVAKHALREQILKKKRPAAPILVCATSAH